MALAAASLCLGMDACGGAENEGRAAPKRPAAERGAAGSPMGDQDDDNPGGGGYYDGDDGSVRFYGKAASRTDTRAIAALVKRYYAAAAAGRGAQACALTYFIDVETLPEQYGHPPGPLWLRGADTCTAVLTRVFAHYHRQLTVPVQVTGVRVNGLHADALVGFATLPAGVVKARREGASWKIEGLLAVPLP